MDFLFKMATKIVFVGLLFLISTVIARDCSYQENIKNCDDCHRCGGTWCYDSVPPKCELTNSDNTCMRPEEEYTYSGPDAQIQTVQVLKPRSRDFEFPKAAGKVKFNLTESTQPASVQAKTYSKECRGDNCHMKLEVIVDDDFCSDNSTINEFFQFKMSYSTGATVLKYHVPCACSCSSLGEINSTTCNNHGDYKCGTCICQSGWKGANCEQQDCGPPRGDTPECEKHSDCHGNGECHCERCKCSRIEGYRYFDSNCRDICTQIADTDSCLLQSDYQKPCGDINFRPYNETLMEYLYEDDHRVWMPCNWTVDGCTIQYAAMIDTAKNVMIIKNCAPETMARGALPVTVPVVLGVLAIVAAVAATAGYMVYKARTPPLPLTDPQYQNIGAEYSQGENPLYKSPTSSFKNPLYGK